MDRVTWLDWLLGGPIMHDQSVILLEHGSRGLSQTSEDAIWRLSCYKPCHVWLIGRSQEKTIQQLKALPIDRCYRSAQSCSGMIIPKGHPFKALYLPQSRQMLSHAMHMAMIMQQPIQMVTHMNPDHRGLYGLSFVSSNNDKRMDRVLGSYQEIFVDWPCIQDKLAVRKDMAYDKPIGSMAFGIGAGVCKEDLLLIKCLASYYDAPCYGTRQAFDLHLIQDDQVIGMQARSLSVDTYVALGLSGSTQHMLGIRAKTIVAINRDAHAPIWRYAHHGWCTDVSKALIFWCQAIAIQDQFSVIMG